MNDPVGKLLCTFFPDNDFERSFIEDIASGMDAIINTGLIIGIDQSAGTFGIIDISKSNIDQIEKMNYLAKLDALILNTYYDYDKTKRNEYIKIKSYINNDITYYIGVELLNKLKEEQNEI